MNDLYMCINVNQDGMLYVFLLDQSTQSSALGGRTSTPVVATLAWLLGHVGGPCDWAPDVCISSFFVQPFMQRPRRLARGSYGPRGMLSAHGV